MYKSRVSNNFSKKLAKLAKNNPQLLAEIFDCINKLMIDPLDTSLGSHKVDGVISCSVNYKIRIIWNYQHTNEIILIDIGPHDGANGVYKN